MIGPRKKGINSSVLIIIGSSIHDDDDQVQDCGNSSALAMELPQSCSKPSILTLLYAMNIQSSVSI